MKQQSRGDVFEGAKLSVEHAPPIVTHAPHTIPLQSHSHSNNHHNTNGNTLQNQPHVVQPRSFSYTSHSNGATHARVPSKPRTIKKIRLIIPRKRKLNQIESAPITNNYQSSDSKENKPNQPQQPPQKKQKLSPPSQQAKPIAPAVRSPITKRHKPQPPSYPPSLDVPIRNGTPSNVQKHNPMTSSLPPPPPLQSMSPPSKIKSPRNPYLHLQSQLKTHYAWPTHNGDGVSYSHICDECGQGFMNGKALGGHKGQHRKAKDCALYEQITRGHQGKNHQYYYPNNHNKNYKKKRTINKHNQRDVNGKYPSHDAQGVAYSHVCDVCHKGFSSGNALGGHRSVHKRMKRMGKMYNKASGRHESSSSSSTEDTDSSSMDASSHVAIATHNHMIINDSEYKEYEGLQNKEIMKKIIDKLCAMDEAKLCDESVAKTPPKEGDDDSKMELETLSFIVIRGKIEQDKYESVQQDFLADINKLLRSIFRAYGANDVEYQSALKLKQFAYRQCTAALGAKAPRKSQLAYEELQCLAMSKYEEISDYQFFCDDEVLREKMTCKKSVRCDGKWCHELSNLGPYCIQSQEWKSQCLCRSKQMECGDECGCDPSTCLNRCIQKKKIKLNGVSIREQEVFGIDQHTRMCLDKALPKEIFEVYRDKEEGAKSYFIEKRLCPAINNFQYFVAEHAEYASCYDPKLVSKPSESEASFMMTDVLRSMLCGNTNEGECRVIEYLLRLMMDMALDQLKTEICGVERSKRRLAFDTPLAGASWWLRNVGYEGEAMICHFEFPIYSKGTGVICIAPDGMLANEYVISFLGVVYAPWTWYEKDDRTRWLVKSRGAPKQAEFFNIMMEKHRDDADGYDLVFIDPSHRGNYGSRLSHSCSPNCISVSMGVAGKYNIAVYASQDIAYGEELCFNYNSVTESEREWHDAVCLCGSANCNGQFLIYAGTSLYTEVLKKAHHLLHRTAALFNATRRNELSCEDKEMLSRYALLSDGSALQGIPEWMKAYAACILRYIWYEQTELPKELQHKARCGEKGYSEFINSGAAVEESKGLQYVRLSNLVITLNKMNLFFRQPVNRGLMQLPLFKPCSAQHMIERIWFAANSIISDLYVAIAIYEATNQRIMKRIQQMKAHLSSIANHETMHVSNQYLMELRDELLKLPPTNAAYHHAASDVLLFYASTTYFFHYFPPFQGFQSRVFTYNELGYRSSSSSYPPPKKYSPQYVWGQLNFWERHSIESPDSSLSAERRGAITLPNIKCCYVLNKKQTIRREYSLNVRKQFVNHLQFKHHSSWSSKWHFGFKNGALFGSPWLDMFIDPDNETDKFDKLIRTMKQTKMIYVDGTFTSIAQEEKEEEEEEQFVEDDDKMEVDEEYNNNQINEDDEKKEPKEKKKKNDQKIAKATRRSNRLRGKQLPSYMDPKENEF